MQREDARKRRLLRRQQISRSASGETESNASKTASSLTAAPANLGLAQRRSPRSAPDVTDAVAAGGGQGF